MKYVHSTVQELLKKCHQCMETIVKAKDQQAAEANKNASILLKELDLEKVSFTSDALQSNYCNQMIVQIFRHIMQQN